MVVGIYIYGMYIPEMVGRSWGLSWDGHLPYLVRWGLLVNRAEE